jgi:hypothetical protein
MSILIVSFGQSSNLCILEIIFLVVMCFLSFRVSISCGYLQDKLNFTKNNFWMKTYCISGFGGFTTSSLLEITIFLILCIYPPYFYYDTSLRGLIGSSESEFRCSRYGHFRLSFYASFHGGGYNPPRTSRTKYLVYLWPDGLEARTMVHV